MKINKKVKLIIGLAVGLILVVVGSILFSHTTDYVTAAQFQPKSDTYYGREVSVSGKVVPGSINWDDWNQIMEFQLAEGSARIAVSYQGLVPQNFKPGANLVVNGRYNTDNVIQAESFGKIRSLCSLCH